MIVPSIAPTWRYAARVREELRVAVRGRRRRSARRGGEQELAVAEQAAEPVVDEPRNREQRDAERDRLPRRRSRTDGSIR